MNHIKLFPNGDFPINEREGFMELLKLVASMGSSFKYLEIGSYLGGSISPLLIEDLCREVVSIDQRGRHQPDERGRTFDYTTITEAQMLDNLVAHGFSVDKIRCVNGSIENFTFGPKENFRMALIDGEHTDFACFRDFIYLRPHLEEDSIVVFDDSNLVVKAVRNILSLLQSEKVPHNVFRYPNTRFTVIGFGVFANVHKDLGLTISDFNGYLENCEESLFWVNVRHRVNPKAFFKFWILGSRFSSIFLRSGRIFNKLKH